MGHLPIIADTFRVALEWEDDIGHAVNVMHFLSDTRTVPEVFAALDSAVDSQMWQAQTGGSSVAHVAITPLDGTSATQTFATGSSADWSGEATGELIPAVSNIIQFQTGERGRSKRGRVYLPFVAESHNNDGHLVSTDPTDIATAWAAFAASCAGDNLHLVVASYKLEVVTAVTNINVPRKLVTQRRRQQRIT